MKQRFLAMMVDDKGEVKDFYRFSCKSAKTVEKSMQWAMDADTWPETMFRKEWEENGVVKCEIYETCGAVEDGMKPVLVMPIEWVA